MWCPKIGWCPLCGAAPGQAHRRECAYSHVTPFARLLSPDGSDATTPNGPASGSTISESAHDGTASPPCGLRGRPGPSDDLSGETSEKRSERPC